VYVPRGFSGLGGLKRLPEAFEKISTSVGLMSVSQKFLPAQFLDLGSKVFQLLMLLQHSERSNRLQRHPQSLKMDASFPDAVKGMRPLIHGTCVCIHVASANDVNVTQRGLILVEVAATDRSIEKEQSSGLGNEGKLRFGESAHVSHDSVEFDCIVFPRGGAMD
jgi:hypothetical protein